MKCKGHSKFFILILSIMIIHMKLAIGSTSTLILTEKKLKELLGKTVPTLIQHELSTASSSLQREGLNEMYSPRFSFSSSYKKTLNPINTYTPANKDPFMSYSAQVMKKFKKGMSLQAGIGLDTADFQTSASSTKFRDFSYSVSANIDLYKNLFGRIDEAKLNSTKYQETYARTKQTLDKDLFFINLRKIYWNLIANKEKIKISNQLLSTAIKQEKNAVERYKNSVADKGEVAIYRSIVARRRAQIIQYKYVKESLIKNIKALIPELKDSSIYLPDLNPEYISGKILQCVYKIKRHRSSPMLKTSYSSLINLLSKKLSEDLIEAKSHDKPDITLGANFKSYGQRESLSDSLKDAHQLKEREASAQLTISIPLDSGPSNTKIQKVKVASLKHDAESKNYFSMIHSQHRFITSSIDYLLEAIKQQQIGTAELEKRLKEERRKYTQGRVQVNSLVQDEDNLLESELKTIDIRLMIIETLLDYFEIFNKFECSFNNI